MGFVSGIFYLFCDHSDDVTELSNDEVNAFKTWFPQTRDLLFHDGLKCHVGRKETNSDA